MQRVRWRIGGFWGVVGGSRQRQKCRGDSGRAACRMLSTSTVVAPPSKRGRRLLTRCACARNEPPAFSTTMLLDLSFWPVFRLLLIESCRRENFHRADRFPGSRPTVNFLSSPLSVPLSFTRPAGSATRAIVTWPSVTCVYSIPSLPS